VSHSCSSPPQKADGRRSVPLSAEARIENQINSTDDKLKVKPINYAITGGTGKYSGARGACQVVLNGTID